MHSLAGRPELKPTTITTTTTATTTTATTTTSPSSPAKQSDHKQMSLVTEAFRNPGSLRIYIFLLVLLMWIAFMLSLPLRLACILQSARVFFSFSNLPFPSVDLHQHYLSVLLLGLPCCFFLYCLIRNACCARFTRSGRPEAPPVLKVCVSLSGSGVPWPACLVCRVERGAAGRVSGRRKQPLLHQNH